MQEEVYSFSETVISKRIMKRTMERKTLLHEGVATKRRATGTSSQLITELRTSKTNSKNAGGIQPKTTQMVVII